MPGIDYLGQSDSELLSSSYDPRNEGYFTGSLAPLALELGGMAGAGYILGRKGVQSFIGRAGRYADKLSSGQFGLTGKQTFQSTTRQVNLASRVAQKNTVKFRRTLSNASKAFGVVGLSILGYEISKSIFGNSRAYSMGTEEFERSRYRSLYRGDDEYFDSRAALTQRQRAIQVIHNSQMSTRAAFGNEATFMHY
jgi:hypothetical protein